MLPKALAIATLSRMAMSGMIKMAEPSCETIPPKSVMVELDVTEKDGAWNDGNPDWTSPVRVNTQPVGSSLHNVASGSMIMASTRQKMTMMAFLAVHRNQTSFPTTFSPVGGSLFQNA